MQVQSETEKWMAHLGQLKAQSQQMQLQQQQMEE
jgi:hypothetical protein